MKKSILTCMFIGGALFCANAQSMSKNAIGLRLGGGNGFGAEISYQRSVGGENNRIELDLGIESDEDFSAFQLTGIYQWVWNIQDGFNWYAGPGAGFGFYSFEYDFPGVDEPSESYFFIAGDIGIEYDFDIPLMISLDLRPELYFDDYEGDNLDFGVGLGIRYQF